MAIRSFSERSSDQRQPATGHLLRVGVHTYTLALVLIAACSVGFHLLTDSIIREQRETALTVNLTGRQRMLAQRVVRLSIEQAAHTPYRPEAETREELHEAVTAMEQGYAKIVQMRQSEDANPLNGPIVEAVYRGPAWHLDEQMHGFLEHAHSLEGRTFALEDADLVAIEAAVSNPLMNALNAAVDAVETSSEAALNHLRRILAVLSGAMLALLLLEAMLLFRPLFKRLHASTEELIRVGRTDPLTGCLNRRAFLQESAILLRRERLAGRPVCLAMLDLDRFKSVNDQYGHPAGDTVIHAVVSTVLRHIRSGDFLCRMGGEEFAVLLPGSTLDSARHAVERLRRAIAEEVIVLQPKELGLTLQVTVSAGLTMLRPDDETIFPVLARADRALYRAKANGRNRVEEETFGGAENEEAIGIASTPCSL